MATGNGANRSDRNESDVQLQHEQIRSLHFVTFPAANPNPCFYPVKDTCGVCCLHMNRTSIRRTCHGEFLGLGSRTISNLFPGAGILHVKPDVSGFPYLGWHKRTGRIICMGFFGRSDEGISVIPCTYTLYSPGGMPSLVPSEDILYEPLGLISPLDTKLSVRKNTVPFGAGVPSVNVTFPVRRLFLPHPTTTRQNNKQSMIVYLFIQIPYCVTSGFEHCVLCAKSLCPLCFYFSTQRTQSFPQSAQR